ncbi:MAG: hypothetical protein SCM96_10800 [Acidobacteriota bacterium]|nr:hypothetical protein [Acidobacteriota bacterium]
MLAFQIQHGPGRVRKDTLINKITAKEEKDRMVSESRSFLDRIIQEGAQRMLQEALKNEVEEYLSRMEHQRIEDGRRAIVRNGHLPDRDLVTGMNGHARITPCEQQKITPCVSERGFLYEIGTCNVPSDMDIRRRWDDQVRSVARDTQSVQAQGDQEVNCPDLGVHIQAVRKVLRQSGPAPYKRTKSEAAILTPYKAYILRRLAAVGYLRKRATYQEKFLTDLMERALLL